MNTHTHRNAANRRLAAAAPDLLSAAIAALTIVLRDNADGSIARDLIRAIHKARGLREYN